MMQIRFGLIALILSLVPAMASAQALSALGRGNSYFGRGAGVLSVDKLKAAGVHEVKTIAGSKEMTLLFLGSGGKVMKQFVWQRTAPSALEQFRPSKFRQWLKTAKTNSGSILASKVRHFPFEATAFFTAIGAINMYDLVFHHSNNPVIMKQFAESQLDPVTHVSFMAFMAANGMTAEPLQEVIRNPRLHYFIPYFGMSMGMMASNVVHDVWASKALRACAKALASSDPAVDQKCDSAWDEMNLHWNDKWGQYATGWLSMMGSTAIGGAIDWVAGAASRRALQFLGLELAFSFGTGGMSMVARFAWTTVKNIQFLALDFWLRHPIETVWLNVFGKGSELNHSSMCLGTLHQISRLGTHRGEHPRTAALSLMKSKMCKEELVPALKTFARLNQEWRIENTKQILAAHQNWQTYLSNFASHYRSTRLFYQHLTDQIWKKNYGGAATPSPLDQVNQFFGVLPEGATDQDWTLYLQDIRALEALQLKRIENVAKKWTQWLASSAEAQQLARYDRSRLETFLQRLGSKDVVQIKKALDEMNRLLPGADPDPLRRGLGYTNELIIPSQEYVAVFAEMAKELGRPRPVTHAGEGFLKAWAALQGRDRDSETQGQSQAFDRQYGSVSTFSAPEYLVAAMVSGPDIEKGEKIVDRSRWGGLARFNPPRILFSGDVVEENNLPLRPDNNAFETVFTNLIRHEKRECKAEESKRACYAPTWTWLRNGWIRPEVMTKSGNNMAKWWAEKVEPSYLDAWYEFETEYENVVKTFANQLLDANAHWSNGTGFANATVPNLEQERQVYLMFLNDFIRARQGEKLEIVNAPYRIHIKAKEEAQQLAPALEAYSEVWDEVLAYLPRVKDDLSGQMDSSKGVLVSRVPNEKIEEGVKRLDEVLIKVSESMGIREDSQDPQEQAARVALEFLKGSHLEMLDYGLVLNTASYSENHSTSGQPQRARCIELPNSGGSAAFRGQNKGCP